MKKWEYMIVDSMNLERRLTLKGPSRDEIEKYFDVLGSEGWEIVNIDWREMDKRSSFTGVAKREIQ
jgi:hypothetical protein